MPQVGTAEDENVKPGGFEAISRWLSPSTTDDTTCGYGPKPVHPRRGAKPSGGIAATAVAAQPPANGLHPCGMAEEYGCGPCRGWR
jgi:hypothetical protein